jgi:phosphoglycerate dehydrogenase-like enzyme
MRVAILDDYQSAAMQFDCWKNLGDGFEIVPFTDHVKDEAALVRRLQGFDALSRMRERTPLPRRVLEQLPRLKLVLCTGVRNADSIDLEAARDLGITVCSTSTFGTPTLEITWALILCLFRRLDREIASLRSGGWQTSLGSGLEGKTLGVLGLGRYGSRVAEVAQVFGMRVVAWSPNLTQERAMAHGVTAVPKDALFTQSDAITIHMPESPRSVGIVGATDIAMMKPSAFLVNTSRAPLIDEPALLAALQAGRIGGLGVDVYDDEPLPGTHPFRYLPNVVATPHIGYVTRENYERMFNDTVENLQAYAAGSPTRVITPDTASLTPRGLN